jgi:hypothetical protein
MRQLLQRTNTLQSEMAMSISDTVSASRVNTTRFLRKTFNESDVTGTRHIGRGDRTRRPITTDVSRAM